MGKTIKSPGKPFTKFDVKNKKLVIKLLSFETNFAKSSHGQSFYKNPLNRPQISLDVEKIFNRITLDHFGYDTSDKSVANYRTIFRTYFKSPDNYDEEVIRESYYMIGNKCVFYTNPPLKIGETIPDCNLATLNATTTLYDEIKQAGGKYTVVAAFSLS